MTKSQLSKLGDRFDASVSNHLPATVKDIETEPAERDARFWEKIRSGYFVAGGMAYLDNASFAPPPGLVLEAQERWQHQLAANPASPMRLSELEKARADVARFVGASADEIAFTRSATEGFSLLLYGVSWKEGDEVLFDAGDHPSARATLDTMRRRYGVRAVDVNLGSTPLTDAQVEQAYANRITTRTRLLFTSHVSGWTGRRHPVKALGELARANGILSAVDASQSFGALEFSAVDLGVDYVFAPGHKWASAGHGGGFAFFRRDAQTHVWPTTGGFYDPSSTSPFDHSARRYDRIGGQKNIPFMLGFSTALAYQRFIGRAAIENRLFELSGYLRAGLATLPNIELLTPAEPSRSGSLVCFKVASLPATEIQKQLFDVARVRVGVVDDESVQLVRVSPHIHNGFNDVDRLLSAVERLVA